MLFLLQLAPVSPIILLQLINTAINPGAKGGAAAIEVLREHGLSSLFADIYKSGFHLDWAEPNGRLFFVNMHYVANAMWNSTDNSAALCQQVVEEGLARDILLTYLSDPKVSPRTLNENGIMLCVRPLLSILHNVVQVGRCLSQVVCMYA